MKNTYALALSLFLSFNLFASSWNGANNPAIMDPNFKYKLSELPTSGSLHFTPWSETYWASMLGSINYRWNHPNPTGFNTYSYSKEELMKMTREELSWLSPSEKYDIYMGRYDYPAKRDAARYGSPRSPDWAGSCDGWSIATLQYEEPAPKDMVNPDGIVVPFGASDIKGLMSFYAATKFKVKTKQVGLRCFGGGMAFKTAACMDINAGALHVITTNQIGIKKEGFVADIYQGKEVWNQAVFSYNVEFLGSSLSSSAYKGAHVKMTLFYIDELDTSKWDQVVGTDENKFGTMEMEYILDLDSNGNITGGSYLKGEHPDFVWLPTNKLTFEDYYQGINDFL